MRQTAAGGLAVLASALCFYLATVVIGLAHKEFPIGAAYFVFARSFVGFFAVAALMLARRQSFRACRYSFLFSRGVANLAAIFVFFKAVALTSATEANILNLSYPVFVAVFSWLSLPRERDYLGYITSVAAFIGVLFVINPGPLGVDYRQFWGLGSAVLSAIAVLSLNLSRQDNSTEVVLLYMFGIGTLGSALLAYDELYFPNRQEALYLVLSAVLGVLGQYLLTYGQSHISAVETSIISSSRILIAALLGPYLAGDAPLAGIAWAGAIIIFASNALLAVRKFKKSQRDELTVPLN